MATSMVVISRKLYGLLSNPRFSSSNQITKALFSTDTSPPDHKPEAHPFSSLDLKSESDSLSEPESESSVSPSSSAAVGSDPSAHPSESTRKQPMRDRVLEDGVDVGIYKAIIVGRIGQSPLQKTLKSGRVLVLTTVGTGGMRNERKPLDNEEPREYAERTTVQWHRVAVYHPGLANIVMKHAQAGALVYMEGNLETKIFTDPITGLVRRLREIAIRRNGRFIFLGDTDDFKPSETKMKSIGYY